MNDDSRVTSESALSPPPGSTPSEMFPVLTSAQQARVLAHGQRRTVEQNDIVVELNEHVTKFFVVVSGQLHARCRSQTITSRSSPFAMRGCLPAN